MLLALDHPGWVLLALTSATLGLYFLAARPTAWRVPPYAFSFPLAFLALDELLTGPRRGE